MSETPNEKHLVVFDFDYTIVDCNSDTFVNSLCPNSVVPERVKKLYDGDNWTQYMSELFKYLHEIGVREPDYKKRLVQMPFTNGMKDLILNLKNKFIAEANHDSGDEFELIIISDSNTFFIDTFLEYNSMENVFRKIYTNPASFDADGCLVINEYQRQTFCDISAVNICKGHVMREYIKQRNNDGVTFNLISYIGDGQNDLCPGLKLSSNDNFFIRKGYSLHKIFDKKTENIKAKVTIWETGENISKVLKIDEFVLESPCVYASSLPKSSTPPTPPPSPSVQGIEDGKGCIHSLPLIISESQKLKVSGAMP